MPICPHCQTHTEQPFVSCPTGDGFYTVEEQDYTQFKDDPLLGTSISDRYVFTGVIGHGAIGRVYKGYQPRISRHVVLKVFKLQNLIDEQLGFMPNKTLAQAREDAEERFEREAKVLAQLSHPNCVTLYDFGSADDGSFLYIAMEFVAGISMRRAIQRGLKFEATLEITRQILMALRQAHSLGIVHRDLKPENIILSFRYEAQEPVVKVLDFGIAKLLQQDGVNSTASTGMLFGTPAYMSPEQCRGASDEVSTSSDIYALGCMLYEIVCGKLPFPGQTPQQMIVMHQESPIPPIVARAKLNVPDELATFIRTCLQKDPAHRYANARAALQALDAMMARWGFTQPHPSHAHAPQPEQPPEPADISADSSTDMLAVFDNLKPYSSSDSLPTSEAPSAEVFTTAVSSQTGPSAAKAAYSPAPAGAIGHTIVAPEFTPQVQQARKTRHLILVGAVLVVLTFCTLLFMFFFNAL
jgi:serine/threonine-protein kinase